MSTSRAVFTRPFTSTGVDFVVPFDIRNYTGRVCLITKGYVCLLIFFAMKAIHLETVRNLSTSAFLAALARFISRRGYPTDMYADNGINFVGASKILKRVFRDFLEESGSQVSATYRHWHFNPAGAPHMGCSGK